MTNFLKFAMIGGAATLLQFFLLGVFVKLFHSPATLASALSYLVSSVFNYAANNRLTFNSQQAHSKTLPKFVATVFLGTLLNTAIFYLAYRQLHTDVPLPYFLQTNAYLIAQVFATLLTLVFNYTLHKFWIYRR